MNAKGKIQKTLRSIMSDGEANACHVYKGFDYDGVRQASGWFYRPFNGTPVYLGKNESEALDTIEAIASSREMM